MDRGENLLAFGFPGRRKTHLVCALGAELIQNGYTVHLTPAFALVQRLFAARGSYGLEKALQRLDAFDVLIIDDIGYIQQDRDETEVLFTMLAERYKRRTVMRASSLMFSRWNRVFKDSMTTAATIDRVIYHCVTLELNGTSYRAEATKGRMRQMAESTTT